MTYKNIQQKTAAMLGVAPSSVKTCWVAEVKRHYGLTSRPAPNRGSGRGAPSCPPRYWQAIEKVLLEGSLKGSLAKHTKVHVPPGKEWDAAREVAWVKAAE